MSDKEINKAEPLAILVKPEDVVKKAEINTDAKTPNPKAQLFKPERIMIKLGDTEYELRFDLSAFCELEKTYRSTDELLQMLLGTAMNPDINKVTYCDAPVLADDVKVDQVPLSAYIAKNTNTAKAGQQETLNLLWAGCLHNHQILNEQAEVTGYSITKAKLGSLVSLKNIAEVNAKIMEAILRDLIPDQEKTQRRRRK